MVLEQFAKQPEMTFVGLFDGHGAEGRAVAKYVATKLPQLLAQQPGLTSSTPSKVNQAVVTAVEKTQKKLLKDIDPSYSGTTACFALTTTSHILIGNIGNSKGIMVRVLANGHALAKVLTQVSVTPVSYMTGGALHICHSRHSVGMLSLIRIPVYS